MQKVKSRRNSSYLVLKFRSLLSMRPHRSLLYAALSVDDRADAPWLVAAPNFALLRG